VLDQIEDKLELSFRELGRQNLKIKAIEVYAVELHQRVPDIIHPCSRKP
jgi:hypothetical protein